jgi:hypothetical protein
MGGIKPTEFQLAKPAGYSGIEAMTSEELQRIHLVTHSPKTGQYEATTLAKWISRDQLLFMKKEPPREGWLILGAYATFEEARQRIEVCTHNAPLGPT